MRLRNRPPAFLVFRCLTLAFCLVFSIGDSFAQTSIDSLRLETVPQGIRLSYSLADTNGVFFLLQSGRVTNLFGSGTILASGAATNRNGVLDLAKPTNSPAFFGLLRDPSLTNGDLTPIVDDEVPPDPGDWVFFAPNLPAALPVNTPFPLTLEINDLSGQPVATGGQLTLSLTRADDSPVAFAYTLTPATVGVTNGVAQTALTIKTTDTLAGVFLSAAFAPRTASVSPQGLVRGRALAGPTSSKKVAAPPRVTFAEYNDPNTTTWDYPLPATYPLAGLFGEYPGHAAIHWGVDLTAPAGQTVRAAKRGVVILIGDLPAPGGKYVAMYHGNGYVTHYLHIDPLVAEGDLVERSHPLGVLHDWKKAPSHPEHLHFEMRALSKEDRAIADAPKGYKDLVDQIHRRRDRLGTPVNPIDPAFSFSSSLITDDSHFPSVQAIFLRAVNPAQMALSLPPSNPTPDLFSGIGFPSTLYVVAQVVDYQRSSRGNINVLAPKRITFTPDANPNGVRNVVYGNTEAEILDRVPVAQGIGGTGGKTNGYVLLPAAETVGDAFRERRYKYWFDWDTSAYNALSGPRGFTLLSEDIAGKKDTQIYSFGPKLQYDGQPWTVPEGGTQQHVSVKSSFGPLPNPNPSGALVILDIGYATATASPPSDWAVEFVGGGLNQASVIGSGQAGFSVTSHNQITDLAMNVRALRTGVTSGTLTLRVNSAVFPNIHDEVTIQLAAQPTKEPIPIPAMVRIPAGTFAMGSPETEKERDSDETQHTVTLTKDFYMSKYEVTQREYLAVMGNNPSYINGGTYGTDLNRPVERVSWNDAMSYCAKVTASEQAAGRLTAGWEYRLPTEAEWEYACRAGTSTPFHYGPDLRSGMANFYGDEEYVGGTGSVNNPNGIYLYRTTTVGSYQPNAFGLYDMHGNVWEWCLDWYGAYPVGSVTDPRGPALGSLRVVRGGCWFLYGRGCRSAIRYDGGPGIRISVIGFRPVLAPGQ